MIKALSLWLDRKMGLPPGWGVPIVLWGFAVAMQWLAIFLQAFYLPWLQTILAPLYR